MHAQGQRRLRRGHQLLQLPRTPRPLQCHALSAWLPWCDGVQTRSMSRWRWGCLYTGGDLDGHQDAQPSEMVFPAVALTVRDLVLPDQRQAEAVHHQIKWQVRWRRGRVRLRIPHRQRLRPEEQLDQRALAQPAALVLPDLPLFLRGVLPERMGRRQPREAVRP